MSFMQDFSAQSFTVQVVDDTAANRQILQVFLKKLGFKVIAAEDGIQAVEQFSVSRPDIVLMDVMMPVMDGYEATRRIKALCGERWVPVVFLSALDKHENLVAGLDAGGDDYLHKPVNFVVLEAKLRSLMRTMNVQQALAETRRRAQAISDNIIDGVITIDQDGNIQSANPSALNIFAYA
ncbi:MAG: response regulator, partial [Pseudomonadota bacterium]